jgi:hypothetical protein
VGADRFCIFCGSSPLTKQHVWGKQLSQLLPSPPAGTDFRRSAIRHDDDTGWLRVARTSAGGSPFTFEVRCVCGTCNSVWMNRTETAAKGVLRRILEGKRRLGREHSVDLATWIAMTSIVAQHVDGETVVASAKQCAKLLRTRRPPDHTMVFVGTHDRPPWSQLLMNNAIALSPARRAPTTVDTHTTTMLFGSVFLFAFSSTLPVNLTLSPAITDRLVPLWPVNGAVHLPRRRLTAEDIGTLANTLPNLLNQAKEFLASPMSPRDGTPPSLIPVVIGLLGGERS